VTTEAQPVEPGPEPDKSKRKLPPWVPVALVFSGLCAAVAFLLLGSDASNAFVYSKLVDEVMTEPGRYADRELRVEGELRQGSIRFREDPCEWQFVLEKDEHAMTVTFPECVVPDTFRDGMGISVTVQGRLEEDGTFLANQVVPRCPSKYEMEQRNQDGEETPHVMEAPATAANSASGS